MEPSTSSPAPDPAPRRSPKVRLRRQTLESLLEEIQRALDMLRDDNLDVSFSEEASEAPEHADSAGGVDDDDSAASLASDSDYETDQLCGLLKSGFESPEFLQKIDEIQKSVYQNGAVELDTSWDIVKAVDLWEDDNSDDGYVLVKQEDAAHGLAFFIATYILSLKKTKELSPDLIKKALTTTFSAEKRKSKLRKACDGTRVVYNVASWSATAIGIYHNQAILKVATTAFRTSCRVISKLL